jgi:hypothetical protein
MTTHESGSLLVVLIVQACVQGGIAIAMFVAFLYSIVYLLPKHHDEHQPQQHQHDDEVEVHVDMKDPHVQTWQLRRYQLLLGALQNIIVALVVAGMCIKLGTLVRSADGVRVNWTYFALGESAAFFLLGLGVAVYFEFHLSWSMLVVACMMAAWPVCFGVAPLLHLRNQRLFLFVVGVLLQVAAFLYSLWSTKHPLALYRRLIGLLPQLVLLAAYFLYDFFWYVGYLNIPHPGLTISERWASHLAFFFASLLAHVVLPVVMMLFYNLDKETHYHAHKYFHALRAHEDEHHSSSTRGEGTAIALQATTADVVLVSDH